MSRIAGVAITAFLSFFGCWTVLCNLAVLLEFSFYGLLYALPLFALAVFVEYLYLNHLGVGTNYRFPLPFTGGARGGHLSSSSSTNTSLPLIPFVPGREISKVHTNQQTWGVISASNNLAGFLLAVVLAVGITYLAHRPDLDDSHYINMAAGMLDFKHQPMLKFDTMHGIAGLPIHLSNYRFQSYELLAALISWLTKLPVIVVMHAVLPIIFAGLTVSAYALLYTRLLPESRMAAVFINIAVLLILCGFHRDYGNFGFLRLFQGKAILVTLMMPLIWWAVINFYDNPGKRSWLVLLLTQICGVGLSTNGLFVAPLMLGITSTAEMLSRRGNFKIILQNWLATLSACFYPVLCAVIILAFMPSPKSALMGMHHTASQTKLFGEGWLAGLHWLALLLGWVFAPGSRGRLFFVSFLSIILLLNPLLAPYWSKYITINHNWRLLWAVPIPAIMTLVLAALLHKSKCFFRFPASGFWLQLLFILALFTAGTFIALRESNNTSISFSLIKALADDYNAARVLRAKAGAHKKVIAPEAVAGWLVTMQNHPYPLVARGIYFNLLRSLMPPDTWNEIHKAQQLIDGAANLPGTSHALRNIITSESICWVMIAQSNQFMLDIQKILDDAGFKQDSTTGGYILYHKACV